MCQEQLFENKPLNPFKWPRYSEKGRCGKSFLSWNSDKFIIL